MSNPAGTIFGNNVKKRALLVEIAKGLPITG
jgi:hypothetical protein